MIVMVNVKKRKEKLIREYRERKQNADGSIEGRKSRFLDMIFSGKMVEGSLNLTRMIAAQRLIERQEKQVPERYSPALLTTNSRHFRVQTKPAPTENE